MEIKELESTEVDMDLQIYFTKSTSVFDRISNQQPEMGAFKLSKKQTQRSTFSIFNSK